MALRVTLLADGSSDAILRSLISWLLKECGLTTAVEISLARFDVLRVRLTALDDKVRAACRLYPCDVLFIHRDAETQAADDRYREIESACAFWREPSPKFIGVVPVRMTEAWFLFNRTAIANAAGRPSAVNQVTLPPLSRLESVPDPKTTLHDALRQASGRRGRRLSQFRPEIAVHRLAELIDDYAPLRALPAFSRLETDVNRLVATHLQESEA